MSVRWNGGEILSNVAKATAAAIDETTSLSAEAARAQALELSLHEVADWIWFGLTPRFEEGVDFRPAEATGGGMVISGAFGTTVARGGYGAFLERVHPFLRPIADVQFPQLAERIRSHLGTG